MPFVLFTSNTVREWPEKVRHMTKLTHVSASHLREAYADPSPKNHRTLVKRKPNVHAMSPSVTQIVSTSTTKKSSLWRPTFWSVCPSPENHILFASISLKGCGLSSLCLKNWVAGDLQLTACAGWPEEDMEKNSMAGGSESQVHTCGQEPNLSKDLRGSKYPLFFWNLFGSHKVKKSENHSFTPKLIHWHVW